MQQGGGALAGAAGAAGVVVVVGVAAGSGQALNAAQRAALAAGREKLTRGKRQVAKAPTAAKLKDLAARLRAQNNIGGAMEVEEQLRKLTDAEGAAGTGL